MCDPIGVLIIAFGALGVAAILVAGVVIDRAEGRYYRD